MKTDNELIIPISELRLILDFMPEYNEPTGGGDSTTISWNDLMPIIEKIEAIQDKDVFCPYYVEIVGFECTIKDYSDKLAIAYEVEPTKIKATYKAIMEFIKWYNQEKNP